MLKDQKVEILDMHINYHYRPARGGDTICFLHGYPTSAQEYLELVHLIPEEYGIIAHDHLGFGRSDKPLGNEYLLTTQAVITELLYQYLQIERIHLVAHDYGTSVATELIARHNEGKTTLDIQSVTLCNGSMLIDMAELRIIQRLLKSNLFGPIVARLTSSATFHRNMRNIWFRKEAYDRERMQLHWDLLTYQDGRKVLPKITQYIDQRYEHYDRWIGALQDSKLRYHILWAANDPVAVVDMAYKLDELIRDSTLTIMDECGHYPMIEQQALWTANMLSWIRDLE